MSEPICTGVDLLPQPLLDDSNHNTEVSIGGLQAA